MPRLPPNRHDLYTPPTESAKAAALANSFRLSGDSQKPLERLPEVTPGLTKMSLA